MRRLAWIAAAIVVVLALGVARLSEDPVRALERRVRPVTSVIRNPAHDLGPRVERWHIVLGRRDTVRALWRQAPTGVERPWVAVIIGGIITGDRAALLLPDEAPCHTLAVDWPWRGPRRMSAMRFVLSLPAIREALLRTPAAVAAGLTAATGAEGIDPERVVLIGASLGAPIALAALRISDRPRALVLVDGSADLKSMLRAGASRHAPDWLAGVAAPLGAWLLRPLEPERNAPAARTLPVLLFNARHEQRFHPGAVARLHAALPHARVVWRESGHILPQEQEVIRSITEEVIRWLEELNLSPHEARLTTPSTVG